MGKLLSRHFNTEVTICCLFLLLMTFTHHIDKYLHGGIIPQLLTILLFLSVVYFTLRGIRRLMSKRGRTWNQGWVTLFSLFSLGYLFLPQRLSSEILESQVIIKACYEGTQNQATLKFRADKSFELHWTGAFFTNKWYNGKWKKIGDTIYLTYHRSKSERLGDRVIIKSGYLSNISKIQPTPKANIHMFYLGDCKHLN